MKKTLVHVYRTYYDLCDIDYDPTNGGVTSNRNTMTFFWDCKPEDVLMYCEENGIDINTALILVERDLWGEDHSYATPLIKPKGLVGPMYGGHFICTSDDNFYKLHGLKTNTPIPVHDRFETQELNDILSV